MFTSIETYRKTKEALYLPYIELLRKITVYQQERIETSYGNIEVTIYRPDEDLNKRKAVYFNFHGGGFVLGFYEQDGQICQKISQQADCVVVNIDYLLAPEHPFPEPIISAAEAIIQILKTLDGIDNNKVFIGGFSAGGNLAIGTTLCLRKRLSNRIRGVVSAYAPLDFSIKEENRWTSKPEQAISPKRLKDYKEWYLKNEQEYTHPLASPIYGNLDCFPSTLILSAEYDSLRQEEEDLAEALRVANNDVTYYCFPQCTHGFTHEIFSYHKKNAVDALEMLSQFIKSHSQEGVAHV